MPVSAAHAERARELQQRYPFFTQRDIVILMDLEEQDARERKHQDPKPAQR